MSTPEAPTVCVDPTSSSSSSSSSSAESDNSLALAHAAASPGLPAAEAAPESSFLDWMDLLLGSSSSSGAKAGSASSAADDGGWWSNLTSGLLGSATSSSEKAAEVDGVTTTTKNATNAGYTARKDGKGGLSLGGSRETNVDRGDGDTHSHRVAVTYADGKASIDGSQTDTMSLDDTKTKSTRGVSVSHTSKDGVAASVTAGNEAVTTYEDQTVTSSSSHNLSYAKGDALYSHANGLSVVDGTDKSSTENRMSVGYGKSGFRGSIGRTESESSDVHSKSTSVDMGWGEKGFETNMSHESNISGVEGHHIKSGRSLGYKDGKVTAGTTSDVMSVDDSGTSIGRTSANTVVYDTAGGVMMTRADGWTSKAAAEEGITPDSTVTNSTVTGGYDAKKGWVGSVGVNETSTTDVSTSKSAAGIGWDGKNFSGNASSTKTLSIDDDHKLTTDRSLAMADGKVTASMSESASAKDEEGVATASSSSTGFEWNTKDGSAAFTKAGTNSTTQANGDSESHSWNGKAGFDSKGNIIVGGAASEEYKTDVGSRANKVDASYEGGKLKINTSKERTLSIDDDHALTNKTTVGYADGKATFGMGESTKAKDADGTATTSEVNNTLSVGADGVTAGRNVSSSVTNADGSGSSTTGGMSFGTDGKISGNLAKTTKNADIVNEDGTTTAGGSSTVSGSGMVDFGEHGLQGAEGKIGYESSGPGSETKTNVSANGKYSTTLGKPKQVGGKWVVTYERTLAGGIGGGASHKGASGNMGLNASNVERGQRTFASEREAKAFYQKGDLGETGVSSDASDAFAMSEGETRGEDTTTGMSAGGSVNISGVNIGAGGGLSTTSKQTLERTKDGVVLGDGSEDTMSGQVSMGAVGVGMSFGGATTDIKGQKILFEDTTAGRAAYEAYQKTGKLPEGAGYRVMSETTGTRDTSTQSVNMFGAGLTSSQSVESTDTTAYDKDGTAHSIEKDTGTNTVGLTIPLIGSFHEGHSLSATQIDNKKTVYSVNSQVNATYASDINAGLARSTGTYTDPELSGKATGSGKWNVTSSFTEDQIDTFIGHAMSDNYSGRTHGMIYNDAGVDLQEKLRKTKDPDERRRLLAEFIADGGDAALSQVRDQVGKPDYHVELEGDKFMTGFKGYASRQKKLVALKSSMDTADVGGSLSKVRALLSEVRERRDHIGNTENYPELPRGVRQTELSRDDSQIVELERLRNELTNRLVQDESGSSDQTDGEGPITDGETPATEGAEEEEAPSLDVQRASRERELDTYKDKIEDIRRTAVKHEWVHGGAYAMQSARDRVGYDGWFSDGSELKAYGDCDAYMKMGKDALAKAQELERKAMKMPDGTDAQKQAILDTLHKARSQYGFAGGAFKQASRHFGEIKERHADKPGWFVGYGHRLPEGM